MATFMHRTGTTLFVLNAIGTNLVSLQVQPGSYSTGERVGDDTLVALASDLQRRFNLHEKLLAALKLTRELPALYEILEYGPGGTTEECEARERIDAIHIEIEQLISESEAPNA